MQYEAEDGDFVTICKLCADTKDDAFGWMCIKYLKQNLLADSDLKTNWESARAVRGGAVGPRDPSEVSAVQRQHDIPLQTR